MPTPEGWEWLNELPDEWETPSELQEPTGSPEVNLGIKLLSCDILGQEVRVAIGHFITEQALYTTWFLEEVKHSVRGARESALLSEVPMEQTQIVYDAWKEFDNINELVAPNDELRNRRVTAAADLTAALEGAVASLMRVRKNS